MKEKVTLTLLQRGGKKGQKPDKLDTVLEHIMDRVPAMFTDSLDKKKPSTTTTNWSSYHADLLVVSLKHLRCIYQVDVEHPTKKFRIYYYEGKSQFCKTLDEKFDEKLLV